MSYNRRTLAPDSPFAVAAAVCMFLSAAVRIAYCIVTLPLGPTPELGELAVQYLLPLGCCLVMGFMLLSRKNSLLPTIIPMSFGVLFFVLKTLRFADDWILSKPIHVVLCCALYAVFGLVYILTVTGALNTRAVLMLLCGLPFLFHILVEDVFLYRPESFLGFLPELSVLLMMIALFAVACGMRRGRQY